MPTSGRRGKKPVPAREPASPPEKQQAKRRRKRKPRDLEAKLDRAIIALLGRGPEDYSPVQWRGLREHLRLVLLYPGRWVAFCDHHEGEGQERRLVRREVLCVSRSSPALNRRLDKLLQRMPPEAQFSVGFTYIEPPDSLPWV
jgi:hypothetical protein